MNLSDRFARPLRVARPAIACMALAWVWPQAAAAQSRSISEAGLDADTMLELRVLRHDTLIGLSRSLLVAPTAWREVARINRLRDPDRLLPGQVLRVPARLLRQRPVQARAEAVTGEVYVRRTPASVGGVSWVSGAPAPAEAASAVLQPVPLRVGDVVAEGDAVTTGLNGSAVLALADGSRAKLLPGSLVELNVNRIVGERPAAAASSVDAAQDGWFAGTMRLLRGSLEVLASRIRRAKPLEVQTPTAVVGVRGTEYRVGLAPALAGAPDAGLSGTRTEVLQGGVSVRPQAHHGLARPGAAAADRGRAPSAEWPVQAGYGAWLAAYEGDRPPAPVLEALPAAPDLRALPRRFERPLVRLALPGEVAGGAGWRVQVAADAAFDRVVNDQVVRGAEVRIAGLEDGTWFLRVRSISISGIEGYDATQPFELKARPEPPATLAPRPSGKLPVGKVRLAWAQNTEAGAYRVQVARDLGFQDLVFERGGLTATEVLADLPVAGGYHWRLASLRSVNGHLDAGPWGDAQSFELRPDPAPPSSAVGEDGSLTLSWSGRPGDRYRVELALDPQFGTVLQRAELDAPQWQLARPTPGGKVYFRYRVLEPDGFVTPPSQTLAVEVPADLRGLWLLLLPLLPLL